MALFLPFLSVSPSKSSPQTLPSGSIPGAAGITDIVTNGKFFGEPVMADLPCPITATCLTRTVRSFYAELLRANILSLAQLVEHLTVVAISMNQRVASSNLAAEILRKFYSQVLMTLPFIKLKDFLKRQPEVNNDYAMLMSAHQSLLTTKKCESLAACVRC